MSRDFFPHATADFAAKRKQLAPEIHDAFIGFSERVFAEGARWRPLTSPSVLTAFADTRKQR